MGIRFLFPDSNFLQTNRLTQHKLTHLFAQSFYLVLTVKWSVSVPRVLTWDMAY